MSENDDGTTVVVLPDGTRCEIAVEGDVIRYEVDPDDGTCNQANYYSPEDARDHASTIREREMASWLTIWPEDAEPVLDVARALERAANRLDG